MLRGGDDIRCSALVRRASPNSSGKLANAELIDKEAL